VIDAEAHTVVVNMPDDTDPSALVATFGLSDNATAFVGEVEQESGTTANDFTSPVTYKVVAEDETEQEWTVIVFIATA